MDTDVQRNMASLSPGGGKQTFVRYILYSLYNSSKELNGLISLLFKIRIGDQESQRKAGGAGDN
jgi:hypothetical protein